MTPIQLIEALFDLRRPAVRMGAPPAALLPRLAALPLTWAGAPVLVTPEADLARIAAALAVNGRAPPADGPQTGARKHQHAEACERGEGQRRPEDPAAQGEGLLHLAPEHALESHDEAEERVLDDQQPSPA